jgi:hypothetical protein
MSLNDLNGMRCSIAGTAGTTSLTFASSGVATLTCTLPPPPPPPLTSDAWSTSCAGASQLGSIDCQTGIQVMGTIFPAGDEDWFTVSWNPMGSSCRTMTVTMTASSGIQFDVQPDCTGNAKVASAVTNAILRAGGTFYVRIYGATPNVTGTFTMTVSVQ